MDQKMSNMIPKNSLIYIALCLFGVLVFIFAGIIPSQRSLAQLDREIEDVKFQADEQRTLLPLYQSLANEARKKEEGLSLPQRVALAPGQIDKVPVVFRDLAAKSAMETVSVIPDLKSLAEESKTLSVNMTVRGDFANLRKFLAGVVSVPYVEHIEEMQIQTTPDKLEIRLKIWMVLS